MGAFRAGQMPFGARLSRFDERQGDTYGDQESQNGVPPKVRPIPGRPYVDWAPLR